MLKYLSMVFLPACLLMACTGAGDGTSNSENNVVADGPQADTETAVTTGDPVLDAVIEWIEADNRPVQSLYRTFTLVRSTTGFSDGVAQPGDDQNDQALIQNQMSQFAQQVPPEVKLRMAEIGAARVLFLEPCGARADLSLGVPSSYMRTESEYEMLENARLISATRGVGLRDFQQPKPVKIIPTTDGWSDENDANLRILSLNEALWAAQPKAAGDVPLVILDYSDGCGAGEINVVIKTEPAASQLRLIPEFFFTVCAKQKLDPWSNTQCRWWKDVLSEGGEMVAGTYRYHAQTPDGKIRQGRFSITEKRLENPDGSPVETLNIKI